MSQYQKQNEQTYQTNIFYYIYKKLSKQFRRHYLIKDIQSIKKFEKIFNVWKLLYDSSISLYEKDLINSLSFIFFPKITEENEEKNNIVVDITDNNELENIIISINFMSSPILNVNKIIDNFYFLKLYGEKNEIFELKYNLSRFKL